MNIKTDYVSIDKEEFDGLTTLEHLRHCRHRSGANELTMSWRRNIRPTSDRMLLDLEIKTSRSDGWLPSQLVILADEQRMEWTYMPSKVCEYRKGELYETGMFFVEPAARTLRTLCDANSLKLKLRSADKNEYTLLPEEFCRGLQLQAKQFYNNTYDDTLYTEAVSGPVARNEDEHFAQHIARRERRYTSLCIFRLIYGVLWAVLFGGMCVVSSQGHAFSDSGTDLAITLAALSAAIWVIVHLQVLWIEYQKNKECPRCHLRAIKLTGYREEVYQVRSKEQIVSDRLTGKQKSRQVNVTDHEVTQDFACLDCRHEWTRSHIARGY
jgi:hypothetical protein